MSVLSLRRKDSMIKSGDYDVALSQAAWDGDEAAVQVLLDNGANIESKDEKQGRTPLSFAALGGHEKVVRLLLDKGAKIESADKNSQTPLSWAAWGGGEAVVQLLLNSGAKVESKDKKQGRTPLSFAAFGGHEKVVQLLLNEGAAMESKDNDGRTPLWWANWGGHMAVAQLLTRLASSASAMNTKQISQRLRVGKEDAPAILAPSAPHNRHDFHFARDSSHGGGRNMASLCKDCRSANLSVFDFAAVDADAAKQGISGTNIIKRTRLAAIKDAKHCHLCQLIVYALEDTRSEWSALDGKETDDSSLQVHVRLIPYPWFVSRPFNVLNIETAQPFSSSSFGLQLFPSTAQGRFVGRVLGPQVSLPLIKVWVKKCTEHHGQDCGQSKTLRFKEIEPMMLAVDVDKECVTAITTDDQYLALSYVWGKAKSLCLQKSNFKQLQRPGGLSKVFPKLPRTIQDAITFAKQLGQRYIWIDCLCILQDDEEFKSKIIHKMDLVYGNAFMTLIAGSGSDSNSGLSGIGLSPRTSKQRFADVGQDLRLIYAPAHTNLLKEIWASRAWTYVTLVG